MILEARAILDTAKIERLVKRVGDLFENIVEKNTIQFRCGASLAHYGFLGSVRKVTLVPLVDPSPVPAQHLTSLLSCVTDFVFLSKVSGYDLVSLFTSLKCQALQILRQSLGREETRALVQAMESSVEEVVLGWDLTLDMEALAEYSGQGVCRQVLLSSDSVSRYQEELKTWARSRNWRVAQDGDGGGVFEIIKCS